MSGSMPVRVLCWTLNAVFHKPGCGIDQEIELQIEREGARKRQPMDGQYAASQYLPQRPGASRRRCGAYSYAGQGLTLGHADATNLGWKLAAVTCDEMPDSLLDTYTAERRPVAEAVLANTLAK
jgi:FAD binding domain